MRGFAGATPLVDAARFGHGMCRNLRGNADVDHRNNDGCSVVKIAAAANQLEVVQFLEG